MYANCDVVFYFFFCKQKTAYEMRISDWSSDVCSSDLAARDKDIPTLDDGHRQKPRRVGGHDAVVHIIEQRIDARSRLTDREAGREADGRKHALEPLARAFAVRRQFGRYDRCRCMGLSPCMARNQANDALDLRRVVAGAGVDAPLAKPVEP